ncbi:MAG TPA: nucleotidyltransferase domain-containing protein [Allosphingosinicella sp.]|nr:nucleotidyltransferase domain-containing protein [Allosphingosinicella sp.]
MMASEIADHLMGTCASLKHFDAYMFGSTLHGVGQDIDILIVGPGGDLLAQLKKEIHCAGESLPLHTLYMQPSEERHTQFVAREKCIPLAQLASSGSWLSRTET